MKSIDTPDVSQSYAQESVNDWLADMQFTSRMREIFAPKTLPTEAESAGESNRLAEKLAIQLEWMRERDINIRLKDSERPQTAKKAPWPGTVIYFSSKAFSGRVAANDESADIGLSKPAGKK